MMHLRFQAPIFFCAGEPSGDMYAGLLIAQLKQLFPQVKILGVGDGGMLASGANIVLGNEPLMTFGLTDGLKSLYRNLSYYRRIARTMYRLKPKTFVAVAYPGMNVLLCRYAKRLGMRVYYYLPPQIWAWALFRKSFIKRWVDAIISVFPFEAEFYRRLGIETFQIPNPLIARLSKYRRTDHRRRIGFMPGSRSAQIKRNILIINELISMLAKDLRSTELCVITLDANRRFLEKMLKYRVNIIHEHRYQMMKNCDLLITSSGTATLEAVLLGVPQLFFHRPSFIDFHILRRFLRIKEYNLANICFGQQTVLSHVGRSSSRLVQSIYERAIEHMKPTRNKP